MLKLVLIIFQFFIIFLIALFVINNSVEISIQLSDFTYSISSSYIFLFLLIFFLIIFIIQSLYFKTKFNFNKWKINKLITNRELGYNFFVKGMIALANKDYKKATSDSNKISIYLKKSPSLSLLLKSEIFKIEKKYEELKSIYEEMAKNKDTENLAFRGMMEHYLRAQDYHHAFLYGEKLFNKNPYIEKIYDTLVGIVTKTDNWQQLIVITDRAYTKKIINKTIYEENKSIALFEIAKIKKYADLNESIRIVEKALRLRKYFPPYIKLYLELLIENKNYNAAKKFIKKFWMENPHREYKYLIKKIALCLKHDYLELVRQVVSGNTMNEESKILMVEAFIQYSKFDLARKQIKDLLDIKPKKEICILMAKIEEHDSGDTQKVNSWNLRSKDGPDSKLWVCVISNQTQNEWSSTSKAGYFNSLEWKHINMLDNINKANLNLL